MDPIEKRELKRRAFAKLAAQKRRAGLLRGRVVVISLICFVFLWGVVFAQMVTGNDPVLSAKKASAATRTVASAKREAEKKAAKVLGPPHEAEPEEELLTSEVEGSGSTSEAEEFARLEAEEIAAAERAEIEAAEFEEPLVTSQS